MRQNRWKWTGRAGLFIALAALAAAGCAGDGDREVQTIEGRVATGNFASEVIGVRAVVDGDAVATSRIDADGHFAIGLPQGTDYRLEVVTRTGVHGFVTREGGTAHALRFDVCAAGTPFDVGHVHGWTESDDEEPGDGCGDPCMNDPDQCEDPCSIDPQRCEPSCDEEGNCCTPDGTCCDASGSCCYPDGTCCDATGACCFPDGTCCDFNDPDSPCYPPPPCEPGDPSCCERPNPDGSCEPPCNPDDGMDCPPPPCDPDTGEDCPPPPCDPGDPTCCEYPNPDGSCEPPPPCEPGDPNCCERPNPDGSCEPPCNPDDGMDCPPPPPPCDPDTGETCPPEPCDDEGNCCYEDGTCCDATGGCCFPDGTCCDANGVCCYPDGECDTPPEPCDPGDPSCCEYPNPDGSCAPPCDPTDPMNGCEDPRPCDYDENDECWPEPQPPPCQSDPDAGMDDSCWSDGAVPENRIPDLGCGAGA